MDDGIPVCEGRGGIFGNLASWWMILQDYEEAYFQQQIWKKVLNIHTTYRGVTTKRYHLYSHTPDGVEFFQTIYTAADGTITTNTDPFEVFGERRNYRRITADGVSDTSIYASTQFSFLHTVSRYPTQQINTGPGSGVMTVDWGLEEQIRDCNPTDYTIWEFNQSYTYTRLQRTLVSVPEQDSLVLWADGGIIVPR